MKNHTFLRVAEAAAQLHIHPDTALRWLSEGRLRGVKVGARWLIAAESVDRLLANPAPKKGVES